MMSEIMLEIQREKTLREKANLAHRKALLDIGKKMTKNGSKLLSAETVPDILIAKTMLEIIENSPDEFKELKEILDSKEQLSSKIRFLQRLIEM